MKFLCVGYFSPAKMDALPGSEVDAVMSECPPHMDAMYRSGNVELVAGVDLAARFLRRVGGRIEETESAVQAGAERIGCVYLVEAADMADAVRIAALHPTTQIAAGEHLGWRTEIRPVGYFREGKPKIEPGEA